MKKKRTGRPGVLQSKELQRDGHDLAAEHHHHCATKAITKSDSIQRQTCVLRCNEHHRVKKPSHCLWILEKAWGPGVVVSEL